MEQLEESHLWHLRNPLASRSHGEGRGLWRYCLQIENQLHSREASAHTDQNLLVDFSPASSEIHFANPFKKGVVS